MPTSSLEELYKDRPAFAHSFVAQGNYFLGRGGIPIFRSGERVGAIGVSGADAHGEEDIARQVIARRGRVRTRPDQTRRINDSACHPQQKGSNMTEIDPARSLASSAAQCPSTDSTR